MQDGTAGSTEQSHGAGGSTPDPQGDMQAWMYRHNTLDVLLYRLSISLLKLDASFLATTTAMEAGPGSTSEPKQATANGHGGAQDRNHANAGSSSHVSGGTTNSSSNTIIAGSAHVRLQALLQASAAAGAPPGQMCLFTSDLDTWQAARPPPQPKTPAAAAVVAGPGRSQPPAAGIRSHSQGASSYRGTGGSSNTGGSSGSGWISWLFGVGQHTRYQKGVTDDGQGGPIGEQQTPAQATAAQAQAAAAQPVPLHSMCRLRAPTGQVFELQSDRQAQAARSEAVQAAVQAHLKQVQEQRQEHKQGVRHRQQHQQPAAGGDGGGSNNYTSVLFSHDNKADAVRILKLRKRQQQLRMLGCTVCLPAELALQFGVAVSSSTNADVVSESSQDGSSTHAAGDDAGRAEPDVVGGRTTTS